CNAHRVLRVRRCPQRPAAQTPGHFRQCLTRSVLGPLVVPCPCLPSRLDRGCRQSSPSTHQDRRPELPLHRRRPSNSSSLSAAGHWRPSNRCCVPVSHRIATSPRRPLQKALSGSPVNGGSRPPDRHRGGTRSSEPFLSRRRASVTESAWVRRS